GGSAGRGRALWRTAVRRDECRRCGLSHSGAEDGRGDQSTHQYRFADLQECGVDRRMGCGVFDRSSTCRYWFVATVACATLRNPLVEWRESDATTRPGRWY